MKPSPPVFSPLLLSIALVFAIGGGIAEAETAYLNPDVDNTLFQYDGSTFTKFNSNAQGNQIGAGRNRRKNQIQRALLHFDTSSIPADSLITGVKLRLHLLDYPVQDPAARGFWLVPLTASHVIDGEMWGEGTSAVDHDPIGGRTGSGVAATDGDATWFHTQYQESIHGDKDNLVAFPSPGTDPWPEGFWKQEGALGDATYDPGRSPTVMVDSDLYLDEALNFYHFESTAPGASHMVTDVQGWVSGTAANLGWVLIGDESIIDDALSSKRGFSSSEDTRSAMIGGEQWGYAPLLTVEYVENRVPEPATVLLALLGCAVLVTLRRR